MLLGDLLGAPGAMCQAQGWDISAGAIPPSYAMKSSRVGSVPSSMGPGKVLLLTACRREVAAARAGPVPGHGDTQHHPLGRRSEQHWASLETKAKVSGHF